MPCIAERKDWKKVAVVENLKCQMSRRGCQQTGHCSTQCKPATHQNASFPNKQTYVSWTRVLLVGAGNNSGFWTAVMDGFGLPNIGHECQMQSLLEGQVASISDERSKVNSLKRNTPLGGRARRCMPLNEQDSDGSDYKLGSWVQVERHPVDGTVRSNVSSPSCREWMPCKKRSSHRGLRSESVSWGRRGSKSAKCHPVGLYQQSCLQLHVVEKPG